MKKIILLLALFASLIAAAQCPEERVDLFKDRTLKVLPLSDAAQRLGYKGFYADIDLKSIFKKVGKASDYNALVGKEFIVISHEPYLDAAKKKKFKLLLENPEIGRLYYDYEPYDCSVFPFGFIPLPVVVREPEPEPYVEPCSTITEKSTDVTKWLYRSKDNEGVTFSRMFDDEGVRTSLEVTTPYISGNKKGMSVLLSNGVKIERPEATIFPAPSINDVDYSLAFILLTDEEIELVKNYEIVKTTITDVEKVIENGELLKTYFNCILEKQPPASKFTPITCDAITTTFDNVYNTTDYLTPNIDGVFLQKVVGKNATTYYCAARVLSDTMLIGTGVMISFEDGHLINYPDVKAMERILSDGTYLNVVTFVIKKSDISHFMNTKIRGFKIIDAVKPISRGAAIKKLANCLLEK